MRNIHELPPDLRAIEAIQLAEVTRKLHALEDSRARWRKVHDKSAPFSLARTINCLTTGPLNGAEREGLEEAARAAGVAFDPHRPLIPWGLLQRDLTVAGNAAYLVGTSVAPVVDVLRSWSVVARAGITILDNLSDNVAAPMVTTPPVAYALATEATSITESTPVLGTTALLPRTLATFVQFSRLLARQANADAFVRTVMLSALGTYLDKQVLDGSGASGELLGLLRTPNVVPQSGTDLTYASCVGMKKTCSEANAPDEPLAWVATPAVRALLEVRARDATTGSGFIWDGNQIAGRPAYATTTLPAGDMVLGPWPLVVLGLFGPGFVLEIDPYTTFTAAIISARMIVSADVAVMYPASFVLASSIT